MLKSTIALLLLATLCAAEAPTRFRTALRRPVGARVRFLARQQSAPAPGYPAAGVTPEIPFDLPSSTVKPDVTYLPPDNTYGPPPPQPQPDATYGPPPSAPHSTYGPPTEEPITPDAVYGPPDNTYLPPEENITERDVDEVAETEVEVAVAEQEPIAPQPEISDERQDEGEEEGEEIFVAVAEDGSVIAVSNSFNAQEGAAVPQKPARLVFQRFPQGGRRAPTDVAVPARLIKARRVASAKLQLVQRVQPQQKPQGFSFASQYTAW